MNTSTRSRALCATFSAAAVLNAWPVVALAAGGIKAAYVEEVIPSRTYAGRLTLNAFAPARSIGPGSGVLGVTSMTITNFGPGIANVQISSIKTANPGCAGLADPGGDPQVVVLVPPLSTLHLTYPTPLVFNPVQGVTCIAADASGGSVILHINGVVN